jgi:hypothetical protein
MTDFLLRLRGNSIQWPYSVAQFRRDEPGLSISDDPHDAELATYASLEPPVLVYRVTPAAQPSVEDPRTERVEPADPALVEGTWTQQWLVRPATPDEIAAWDAAHRPEPDWNALREGIQTENGFDQAFRMAFAANPMIGTSLSSRLDSYQLNGNYTLFLQGLQQSLRLLEPQQAAHIAYEFLSLSQRCNMPSDFLQSLQNLLEQPTP